MRAASVKVKLPKKQKCKREKIMQKFIFEMRMFCSMLVGR